MAVVKSSLKRKARKPEGMSNTDFVNEVIMTQFDSCRLNWNQMRAKEVVFKPVRIINAANEQIQKLFAEKYHISKTGEVVQIEDGKVTLKSPYWNNSCGMFKFSMYVNAEGCSKLSKCHAVHNLLRETWGDTVADDFIAHEDEIKMAVNS